MIRADRCPGVLRPYSAGDGALVRLRVPGGQTTGAALLALSRAATRYGNGVLQLTSRAGLQIRGLPEPLPDGFLAAVEEAGFLPSVSHERVRNVAASPLTGLSGGRADLRPMVAELDRRLQATPELADLSGRFLFALDDGRYDVLGLSFDLAYLARDADRGWLLAAGREFGVPVRADGAAAALVATATAFLAERTRTAGPVWHVRGLRDWVASLPGRTPLPLAPRPSEPPLGAIGSAASMAVPLALLTADQAAAVARLAPGPVVVTPWRGLVLPGAAGRLSDLVAAGLVAESDSGWARVSACVGSPGCTRSAIDTRALSTALAGLGPYPVRVHISGCERRCGAPTGRHVDLVAPRSVRVALERVVHVSV